MSNLSHKQTQTLRKPRSNKLDPPFWPDLGLDMSKDPNLWISFSLTLASSRGPIKRDHLTTLLLHLAARLSLLCQSYCFRSLNNIHEWHEWCSTFWASQCWPNLCSHQSNPHAPKSNDPIKRDQVDQTSGSHWVTKLFTWPLAVLHQGHLVYQLFRNESSSFKWRVKTWLAG